MHASKKLITTEGKDIVIIGDGPAALITAIKLKQKGLNCTVVGARLGVFTRSGDYRRAVFDEVSAAISPLKVTPSPGLHIKDIERQLYEHAQELGVSLIKKNFSQFDDEKNLVIINEDESEPEKIHADIVFDCTGIKRDVIRKFNDNNESGFKFEIKSVGNLLNENKHYAMVRATLSGEDIQAMNSKAASILHGERVNYDPVVFTLSIEELNKLGWNRHYPPWVYANQFPQKGSSLYKANIYLEVPEGLTLAEVQKFLQTLLWMSKGDSQSTKTPPLTLHHESQKYPHKQVQTAFKIDPHQVTPAFYEGDSKYPLIMHAGDATADLPFTMGQSLIQGIKRINSVLDSFTIRRDKIEINAEELEHTRSNLLQDHANELDKFTNRIVRRIQTFQNLKYVMQIYIDALSKCNDPLDKEVIQKGLDNVKRLYALQHFVKGKKFIESNLDSTTGFNNDKPTMSVELHQAFEHFKEAASYFHVLKPEENSEMRLVFLEMTENLKKLAGHCRSSSSYFANDFVYDYYSFALKIYTELVTKGDVSEKLALYSEIVVAAYKLKDMNKLNRLQEQGKNILMEADPQKNKIVLDKIYYYTALLKLNEGADLAVAEPKENKERIENILNEVNDLIQKLSDSDSEFAKTLTRRVDKIKDYCEKKLSENNLKHS